MTSRWQTIARRTALERGHWLTVEDRRIQLDDGKIIDDWPWIVTPDYVTMVAVTEDERVLCFRQYKYAVGEESLALVAGYLEPGEDPLAAARRELLEETGYAAERWTDLGAYVVDANRGAGVGHLYLATGAHRVTDPDADDLEEQVLVTVTLDELRRLVEDRSFKVLSWVAAAALALVRLDADAHGRG